jgi:hypothetical protein
VRICRALAKAMDGVIDDNGMPIRPEAMDAINTDLEADRRDLAAGSGADGVVFMRTAESRARGPGLAARTMHYAKH